MANGNFGGGNGTSGNPYIVEDAYDLNAVRNNLTAYYAQNTDIDLNNGFGISGWTPIGNGTASFAGNYDGDGKKIRNMYIRDSALVCVGLFGLVSLSATFKNISMENVDITEISTDTGALIGKFAAGNGNGLVQNCHASGYVRGKGTTGGLIGSIYGSSSTIRNIIQCSSAGYVLSSGGKTGGLIGYLCGSSGNNPLRVRLCRSTSYVEGTDATGGLIGMATYYDYIEQCISLGNVKGTAINVNITGGFIGATSNGGVIRKCYSRGSVAALYSTSDRAGGFAGQNTGSMITESYSTGSVTTFNNATKGGFVGYNSSGGYNNCMWNTETSGLSNAYGSSQTIFSGVYGKTSAELKNKETFIGLGWSI